MGKYDKLLLQILRGTSDTNISFDDLCWLLRRFGFEERTRGSHHIFRMQGIEEKINLQREKQEGHILNICFSKFIIVLLSQVGWVNRSETIIQEI